MENYEEPRASIVEQMSGPASMDRCDEREALCFVNRAGRVRQGEDLRSCILRPVIGTQAVSRTKSTHHAAAEARATLLHRQKDCLHLEKTQH